MRLQLVSLIMFHLCVVVDANRRMLINSKQTILMTARETAAAASNSSIHSRMSHHQPSIATSSGVLHRQGKLIGFVS